MLEPSVDETYQILKGLRSRFEEHHNIKYSDAALKAAAEMADRYINEKHLPDKAIDVIDEAGAYQRLIPEEKRVEVIDVVQIENIVAKIARIPPKSVSASDKQQLAKLDSNLKMVVLGQDEAIDNLAAAIKLSRAGLKEPNKPVGSFLFAGPTGVDIDDEIKEPSDESRNLLMIECEGERELEKLFAEMQERGFECKILS